MKYPDCYEAYRQEENRQRDMDLYMEKLPTCVICGKKIGEGDTVSETRRKHVCAYCMEELCENSYRVEVD